MRWIGVCLLALALGLASCVGAMSVRPGVVTERTVEGPQGTTVQKTLHGVEVIEFGSPPAAPPAVQREVEQTGAEVRQNSRAASENLSRAAWVLVSIIARSPSSVPCGSEVVTMRKILMTVGAFILLSFAACDVDPFKESANTIVDAPMTGVPWLDMAKGAAGLVLAVMGWRTSKAVYGAVQYPKRPFTPEEFEEIEAGLVARGWVWPPAAPKA